MRDLTLGSLCSGFGGLDLGLERAGFHVAWHVEPDAACSTVLDAHWPGVPNHGNIKTVDWSAVEPVYALCGGYPCQPFSHAGRRLGEDDPRHLWPFVCAAVRHLRPRIVLLENVSGHRSLGFGRVLGDLAEVGFDACWASVRASDVGAPHGRERVFILAAPSDVHGGGLEGGGEQDGGTVGPGLEAPRRGDPDRRGTAAPDSDDTGPQGRQPAAGRHLPTGSGTAVADTDDPALDGQRPRPEPRQGGRATADAPDVRLERSGGARRRWTGPADDGDPAVANAASGGRSGGPTREEPRMDGRDGLSAEWGEGVDLAARSPWGEYGPAIARWERAFGEPAPDPLDGRGRLNVDLTRWMLGFPPEWHGDTKRTHALRGYGNAVQVQVAELVGRWALA